MATLVELRNLVLTSIGRDDATAITIANAAINYAIVLAALTFSPPDMYRESNVIVTGGTNALYFPNVVESEDIDEESFLGYWEIDVNGDLMPIAGQLLSTNLLDLIKVYNKTSAHKMDFISYEQWDLYLPVGLSTVKYWTLFGNTMYMLAVPETNITLTIGYTFYPNTLTEDADEVPFNHYDSYISSLASSITFAAFEESDAADLWAKIASLVGAPSTLSTKAKAIVEGQRVIMENAIMQGQNQGV